MLEKTHLKHLLKEFTAGLNQGEMSEDTGFVLSGCPAEVISGA